MWSLANVSVASRLLVGSALYPSPAVMQQAITASESQIITVSLRRQAPDSQGGQEFWQHVRALGCHLLPNTAGCRTAKEAIMTAQMARELFATDWIKLEVIGDDYTLQPNPFELVTAAAELNRQGFTVFPYCTEDLILCHKLVEHGCQILMPWAAPIGSGQGLVNPFALKTLRSRFPDIHLIVDAGIGTPAHAVQAMELGYDGVLLNSAIALAKDPVGMAQAFNYAVKAGRAGYLAGVMPQREMASASTPLLDTPFWHQTKAEA